MASTVSRDTSPEVIDPRVVGEAFVTQYYLVLQNCPELLHWFYKDESVLVVQPGPHGATESVTTLQGIKKKILSSDYKGCSVKITSTDIQASAAGGILVAVAGDFIGKDNLRKTFWQTFFVAKQEKSFFVLNDILRYMEAHESLSHLSSNGTDVNASNVPLSHDQETPVHPERIQSYMGTEVMQNEKESDIENTVAEVSNPPVAPSKNEEWVILDSSTLILSDSNTEQDTQKTPNTSIVCFLRKLATKMKF